MMRRASAALVVGSLAVLIPGCRIHVDKDSAGEEKTVQVDTPFGGMHVNTNQITAADLGLPVYPGATIVADDKNNQSADVHMGFGEWQLRVRAISYSTPDAQDKVIAFYRKALARYGDVITCQGSTPVGKPVATSEGLTCADNGKQSTVQVDTSDNGIHLGTGLELKAGSKHHQHIAGIEESKGGKTRFGLVELQLPASTDSGSGSSD